MLLATTSLKIIMLDLKTMKSALEQLEQERKIPKEKIVDAIEQALAAAYKKEYGKRGQVIRARIDIDTGEMEFEQIKTVVDDTLVRVLEEGEETEEEIAEDDERVRYNEAIKNETGPVRRTVLCTGRSCVE